MCIKRYIQRSILIPVRLLRIFLLLAFPLVLATACGVTSEQSTPPEQKNAEQQTIESTSTTTSQSAEKTKSQQSPEAQSDANTSSDADVGVAEGESSNAQVIEPEISSETQIALEPIPEAVAEAEAGADTQAEEAVNIAKIEPAIAKPPVPETPIPASTDPNHFVITVGEKDQRHPQFGKGHKMGFLVNGVPGGPVVVERGKTYSFDVETNPKHDVYISTKPIGWGASPWSEGVEGAYIYQGTMTFTPTEDAPEVLYYSCRNHPNMGGEIHIIKPGEKVDIAKLTQASSGTTVQATASAKTNQPQVSVAMVNQKLMFADMLVNSAASNRVKASDNEQAKVEQRKAEELLAQAKVQLKAGDNQTAYTNAEQSLTLFKSAARHVPSEQEIVALKESYDELLHSIDNFKQSHEQSYKRMQKAGGSTAVDYDKKHVAALMDEAQKLTQKNDYVAANKKLEQAQVIITTAIQQMLNSQTIVYDLNFESPQEEYEYELKRFGGYEELIPIAVEQKQPNEGTIKLMESFVEKGRNKRNIAIETAKGGDYPRAVAMLQDATKEIRRALRMVGVMQ
jgi:HEPN domain-containing protein